MTPSSAEPAGARRAAALVATACVLQVAESFIPHPVPGVRLGLANIVTLVTLAELGFAAALEVALLRTVVASLVLGSFLTPGFLLSFFSAAASTAVMWALLSVSSRFPRWGFSIVGVSVAGAVAHNASQLGLAYLLLIRHSSIFYFAPWMAMSGLATGWLTALVAAEVLRRQSAFTRALPGMTGTAAPAPRRQYAAAVPAELKLVLACAALLAAVFLRHPLAFPALAAGLLAVMAATRLPAAEYASLLRRLRGLSWLAAVSFFFPLFFTPSGGELFRAGPFVFAPDGLLSGYVFAARILVMGWTGFLLNVYASPGELAAAIGRLCRPFGRLGFPAERTGAVIGLAWGELPAFTARARASASAAMARGGWRGAPLRWSVGLAAGVIAGMCVPGEEVNSETAAA
ncbi:MAG: Gx transporter family protein [Elusimicrobiales bacterium]|nr:Gx transporter family protein [Elusimicrobiales bacterium]